MAITILIALFTIGLVVVNLAKGGIANHNSKETNDFIARPEDYGVSQLDLHMNDWRRDELGRIYKNGVRYYPKKQK